MLRTSVVLLLLAGANAAAQQPAVDAAGTWKLTAASFTATIKILQVGNSISGQFIFNGTPCATTASFTGSITTLFGLGVVMDVRMNGQDVSFSGSISGSSITGQYGGSSGGCIGRGPYNWIATRTSATFLPTISGITNAASGASGSIAPGEIISLFADPKLGAIGPTTGAGLQLDANGKVSSVLSGVQVHILPIDVFAPLTFVSAGQINAVVPYQVAGLSSVTVQVQYAGQTSDPFGSKVSATAPGIFTASGTGSGPGAIFNHDGITLNGTNHPEMRGGYISFYVTGEGQISPSVQSGSVTAVAPTPPITPAPLASLEVRINGQKAPIYFAGEAPGLVSGVLQVNVQIPLTVSPGAVPLQILIGGIASPGGVTVAVQ